MKKSENGFISGRSGSVILRAVERFCRWIYVLLANGLLGRVSFAYRNEQIVFEEGTVYSVLQGSRTDRQNRMRRRIAQSIENSRVIGLFHRVGHNMLGISLSVYGIFFLLFGSYSIATYYVRDVLGGKPEMSALIAGVCFFLISIPMLMINMPLFRVVEDSCIVSWIFENFLGLSVNVHREYSERRIYPIVLIFSLGCGGLTYFVSPLTVIGCLLLFCAACVVLAQPEAGVVLAIFIAPLAASLPYSTTVLMVILWLSLIGFAVKLLQGRRVLHIELLDVAILLFAVQYFFGGIATAGGLSSFRSAVIGVSVILAYFLIVNLMRTTELLERCRKSLLISAAVVVVYGLIGYAFERLNAAWVDPSVFPAITRRMTSSFDNPNILAFYLVFVLAFLLPELFHKDHGLWRIYYGVQTLLTLICILLTWSRGAWLGAIVVVLGYLLIYSHKTLRGILMGILPVLCILTLGVDWISGGLDGRGFIVTVIDRFSSIGTAVDSSSQYRLHLWNGVGRMLREYWFSGIGVGDAAFAEVYPLFAEVGLESAVHTHSLYLQTISELGIPGFLAFAWIVILFVQCCFGHMRRVRETDPRCRSIMISGVTLIAALLTMGLADYVFYNTCVTFTFWCAIGYVVGMRRCSLLERDGMLAVTNGTAHHADFAWSVIE